MTAAAAVAAGCRRDGAGGALGRGERRGAGAGQPGAHRRDRRPRQRLHRRGSRARAAPRGPGRCVARFRARRANARAAAARRALRGQEPVRHRRPAHAGRLEDRARPPAGARRRDCWCAASKAAGAVLVGALNMDEYAYGFTTENSHVGATRNPHDLDRIAGGSSGGSGAAVAAGPGAARARLRHQRLDPRARLALRRVRTQAHLRPPAAHAAATPSSPASTTSDPSRARCATWRWPTTRCRARNAWPRATPAVRSAPSSRSSTCCRAACRACASACWAAGSGSAPSPRRSRRSMPWRRRWARAAPSSCRWSRPGAPRPS